MKRILFLLFSLTLPISAHAQDATIPYMDGVPVMTPFSVMEDSTLVFDKPEGQITEVSLICEEHCPSQDQVQTYYNDVFEGMGWTGNKAGQFFNGSRYVRIDYSKTDDLSPSVILTFHSKS